MSALGTLPPPPNELDTHQITTSLQALESAVKSMPQAGHTDSVAHLLEAARVSAATACIPFMWEDGPLVTAMRQGCLLLVDEINLAEDAVLERLNSVLEPGRTLLLAEKGGPSAEQIVAAEGFRVIATMNPGGDHGKRELSPALSNRFTQVLASLPFLTALLSCYHRSRSFYLLRAQNVLEIYDDEKYKQLHKEPTVFTQYGSILRVADGSNSHDSSGATCCQDQNCFETARLQIN